MINVVDVCFVIEVAGLTGLAYVAVRAGRAAESLAGLAARRGLAIEALQDDNKRLNARCTWLSRELRSDGHAQTEVWRKRKPTVFHLAPPPAPAVGGDSAPTTKPSRTGF